MKKKPHGLKGRPSNAKKPSNEKNDTCIHIRCRSTDKKMWELIAKSAKINSRSMNFSEWVVTTLNDAIQNASSEKPLETLKTSRDLENLSRPCGFIQKVISRHGAHKSFTSRFDSRPRAD